MIRFNVTFNILINLWITIKCWINCMLCLRVSCWILRALWLWLSFSKRSKLIFFLQLRFRLLHDQFCISWSRSNWMMNISLLFWFCFKVSLIYKLLFIWWWPNFNIISILCCKTNIRRFTESIENIKILCHLIVDFVTIK